MAIKAIFVFCAVALFVQANTQAICGCNTGLGLGLAGNGYGYGSSYIGGLGNAGYIGGSSYGSNVYVGNGGGLSVTTYSPIAPGGVSVRSENGIEGNLCVEGALPVLSVVTFEGELPTSGQAGVQYGCGNGKVGITSGFGGAQAGAGLSYGAAQAAPGLSYGATQVAPGLSYVAAQAGPALSYGVGQAGAGWGNGVGWSNGAGQGLGLVGGPNGCGYSAY